jgi:hypothetical protein
LFHNNRNGTFTEVAVALGFSKSAGKGMGVAFGDFNRDGVRRQRHVRNFLLRTRETGRPKKWGC